MRPKLARKNEAEYYIRHTHQSPEEGPYPIEVLREKARDGEISRETWFRLADATDYRQLGDDGALAADLWAEEKPFDPEQIVMETASAEVPDHGDGNMAGLLRENVERDRAASLASGAAEPSGYNWAGLLDLKWVTLRWVLAMIAVFAGVKIWLSGDDSSYTFAVSFFFGIALVGLGIILTVPETVRLFMRPIASFFETLLEGSGGGKTADYWTADSLMAQGEHRLAAAEYRRIVLEHPRELQAYLKGIRAARAFDNQKEVDRFHDLAMKNLKSEQDRNLFLSSLDRMDQS